MSAPRYVNLRVQQIIGATTYEDRLSHYNPTPAHGGFLLDKSTPAPSEGESGLYAYQNSHYLSGVQYGGLGAVVEIGVEARNIFRACYGPASGSDAPVLSIDLGGIGYHSAVRDLSAADIAMHALPVACNEVPYYDSEGDVDTNPPVDFGRPVGTMNAALHATLRHPFGDVPVVIQDPTHAARIINWPQSNDEDTVLRFMDEWRRCSPTIESWIVRDPSYLLAPTTEVVNWNSQEYLDTLYDESNLQVQPSSIQGNSVFQGVLAYPQLDFDATGSPWAGPDYSSFTDDQTYYGYFRVPIDVSSGRISWEGNVTFKDIENAAGLDQHVRIELRILGATPDGKDPSPWGDLGAPLTYDPVESGGGGGGGGGELPHYWQAQRRFRGLGFNDEPGLYVGSPQPGDKFVDFAWLAGIHSLNGRSSDGFNYIGVKITYLDPNGDGALPWELDTLRFGWTTPQVIVAGGSVDHGGSDNDTPTNAAESYDPVTGHWRTIAPLPGARWFPISLRLIDGRTLVTGGYDDGSYYRFETFIYNPTSNSWASFPTLLTGTEAVEGAGICHRNDESIFIAGGINGASPFASAVLAFTGDDLVFTDTPDLNVERVYPGMALAPYDGLDALQLPMLYGGWARYTTETVTDTIEYYDDFSGAWHLLGYTMSSPRVGHTVTRLPDGKVVIIGGSSDYNDGLASVDLHNASSDVLQPVTPMPAPRVWHTATLLQDGRVLVVGGSPQAGTRQPMAVAYVLNIFADGDDNVLRQTWVTTPPMHTARTGHAAELLPDGRVLIIGGFDADYVALRSCEIYDPVTNTWTLAEDLHTARAGFGCGSGTGWSPAGGGQ